MNDAGEMIQQFEDDKLETDDNIYGNMDGKIEQFAPSPIRESVSPSRKLHNLFFLADH